MKRNQKQEAVWSKNSKQWQRVGVPLRPTQTDGIMMMSAVRPVLQQHSEPAHVAVLGVTPEVVQLPWPDHVQLHAFDHSAEMIATVWQAHPHVPSHVQQTRWQAIPLSNHIMAAIVGDGALNVIPETSDYPEVLAELHRVLHPEGILCLRCFVRPERKEDLKAVQESALVGEIQSFHALKWRVAMALSEGPGFSVPVENIHTAFEALFPDRNELARVTGWHHETVATIDSYRGMPSRYSFPTLPALLEKCSPFFEMIRVTAGDYELGGCCPTISFAPRPIEGL